MGCCESYNFLLRKISAPWVSPESGVGITIITRASGKLGECGLDWSNAVLCPVTVFDNDGVEPLLSAAWAKNAHLFHTPYRPATYNTVSPIRSAAIAGSSNRSSCQESAAVSRYSKTEQDAHRKLSGWRHSDLSLTTWNCGLFLICLNCMAFCVSISRSEMQSRCKRRYVDSSVALRAALCADRGDYQCRVWSAFHIRNLHKALAYISWKLLCSQVNVITPQLFRWKQNGKLENVV